MTPFPRSATGYMPKIVTIIYLFILLLVSANAFVSFSETAMKIRRLLVQSRRLEQRALIRQLHASSSSSSNDDKPDQEYSVEVSYDGRSCNVFVRPYETLLAAMERSGAADRLSIPSLPSDCRRGNCLTCSGRHVEGSEEASLIRGEDGLSPHMSQEVQKAGYFLTCSTFVAGSGLKIQLGENNDVWNAMYQTRIEDEMAEHIGRVAKARVIRRAAESNVPKWTRQTEQVLDQTE